MKTLPTKPKLSHRRSRSLGEVFFIAPLSVDDASAKTEYGRRTATKLSCANLKDQPLGGQGLEQIKQSLLREIKCKLKKQIEPKLECHKSVEQLAGELLEHSEQKPATTEEIGSTDIKPTTDNVDKHSEEQQQQSTEDASIAAVVQNENADPVLNQCHTESSITPTPTNPPPVDENGSKRFSICSLSGGELRKRYSPVYERTRKLVRQGSSSGSGSINRWSSSQPQVVTPQHKNGPNSPSASVDTQATVTALSPVASKGDLEAEKDNTEGTPKAEESQDLGGTESNLKSNLCNGDYSVPSSQQTVTMDSSTTKIGQYSAHPSVYVIEQEDRNRAIHGSSGIGESQSDKMDRSTSTLKRGASFKGLRKNIKKVRPYGDCGQYNICTLSTNQVHGMYRTCNLKCRNNNCIDKIPF